MEDGRRVEKVDGGIHFHSPRVWNPWSVSGFFNCSEKGE
jgi:hypothetical protein